jgi:glycosyltransferase involved in cell wall biosynthesis
MKILYFIDGLRAGGKERQLMELLKNLAQKEEFQLDVAVMNEDVHYKEIFDLDIEVHYLLRRSRRDLSVFYKLYKLSRILRPHIIHAWDSLTAVHAVPAARLLGIKFVNGFIRHAARPRPFSKFWAVSKLSTMLSHRTVSNSMAGLEAHHLKPSKKNRCIVNGFNLERISGISTPEETRKRFAVSTPYVVGMVANFEDRKDYNSFLKAAERILEQRDDVSFIAVGDGKNFEKTKKQVNEKHKDRIKLVGNQTDVESIINIFNIGLLINNISGHAEGTSNSIMEYMALEKPVIATNSGGSKELVQHDKTGFIIRPSDVDELTARIRQLLDNKEQAEDMGLSGKQRIDTDFSIDRMVNTYIELYNGLF